MTDHGPFAEARLAFIPAERMHESPRDTALRIDLKNILQRGAENSEIGLRLPLDRTEEWPVFLDDGGYLAFANSWGLRCST